MLLRNEGTNVSFSRDQLVLQNSGLVHVYTDYVFQEVDEDVIVLSGTKFILARNPSAKVVTKIFCMKLIDLEEPPNQFFFLVTMGIN